MVFYHRTLNPSFYTNFIFFENRQIHEEEDEVICERTVRTAMADSWHQPDYERRADKLSSSVRSLAPCLERLNNDCRLMVYKYLKPSDFVNLAVASNTLYRFNVQHIYPKFRTFDMADHYDEAEPISMHNFRRMMAAFGAHVENIIITKCPYKDDEWRYLLCALKLCRNLRSFRISNLVIPDHVYPQFRIRLSGLEEMHIRNYCTGIEEQWWKKCLQQWSNLKVVDIRENLRCSFQLLTKCKQLESVTFVECPRVAVDETMVKVFRQNSATLRHLCFSFCTLLRAGNLLPTIVQHLPELHSLSLRFEDPSAVPNDLLMIAGLNHLQRLLIECGAMNIYPMLICLAHMPAATTLVDLTVVDGLLNGQTAGVLTKLRALHTLRIHRPRLESDDLFEKVSQLAELRTFQATRCESLRTESVVELVRSCTRLESVDVTHCSLVTFEAARQIVEILRGRRHLGASVDEDEESDGEKGGEEEGGAEQEEVHVQCPPVLQFNLYNGESSLIDVNSDANDVRRLLTVNCHLLKFTQNERVIVQLDGGEMERAEEEDPARDIIANFNL